MSIDEHSINNDKDHPPISNKKLFNSFNINRVNSILLKKIIKIPINDNVFNTQQRPKTNFSFYPRPELGLEDSYSNLGKNSAFTSKKKKKIKT